MVLDLTRSPADYGANARLALSVALPHGTPVLTKTTLVSDELQRGVPDSVTRTMRCNGFGRRFHFGKFTFNHGCELLTSAESSSDLVRTEELVGYTCKLDREPYLPPLSLVRLRRAAAVSVHLTLDVGGVLHRHFSFGVVITVASFSP